MNALAERYVRLVLALGQHDADYVDAYYGPPGVAEGGGGEQAAAGGDRPRCGGRWQTALARRDAGSCGGRAARLRHEYLTRSSSALRARVAMLQGTKLTFDEESKALYDAVAPTHTEQRVRAASSTELRAAAAGAGPAARALRRVPQPVRHSHGPARCDVQGGDRRMPQPHAAARHAAARTRASPSSTSPTRAGAATTGTRATTAA